MNLYRRRRSSAPLHSQRPCLGSPPPGIVRPTLRVGLTLSSASLPAPSNKRFNRKRGHARSACGGALRGHPLGRALSPVILVVFFLCQTAMAQEGILRTETKDTNGDGRPDEWTFYEGEKISRIERDRDGNGKPEVWIHFTDGKPTRSEVDRNGDELPDLIRWMQAGRPVREQGDLNFDGKSDSWAFYKEGFKDLMILDKNHDERPDARFYYGQAGTTLVGGVVDEDFDGTFERSFGAFPEKEERVPWSLDKPS